MAIYYTQINAYSSHKWHKKLETKEVPRTKITIIPIYILIKMSV